MAQKKNTPPWVKLRAMIRASAVAIVRPVVALRPRDTARRRVLFVCSQELQARYLAEIWDILKVDSRLDCCLMMLHIERLPGEFDQIRKLLPLQEIPGFWASAGHWDLIVMADHLLFDRAADERHRILRISHGFPGKLVGGHLYAFGPRAYAPNGRVRYSRMFVPSQAVREWALQMDPAFDKIVAVVGSIGDDKMLAEVDRREEYRSQYGFKPDETVVFTTGTWGPHGFFQKLGDAFLDEARALQDQFRFILSAHPIDYRPQPPGHRALGQYISAQSKNGFIIREPSENWVPYMIASDILLTDHTSLALHGVLLGLPFVFSPVPDELVETGTVIRQIRDISHTLRPDASDLRQALRKARSSYPFDKLREIASQVNSFPHEATDRMREEIYEQLQLSLSPCVSQLALCSAENNGENHSG